ncbi:hypothetical protein BPT24_172 [Tenacibaculum phage pT24]|uniref:Uncharacterized protein n=1 Tax=Tenacibaculum phage pT24 TaxID=1880590 RepID=A0A1B4XWX7_9CAUD|nr:hypothetical protein HYP10_gp172 [Tenacibaculum phage pT24]BAV39298.1 hypothetical protein BPT24_172 [Tenacibaculum phage pT24]
MKTILEYFDPILTDMVFESAKHKLTSSDLMNVILQDYIEHVFSLYGLSPSVRVMVTRLKNGYRGYVDMAKVTESDKTKLLIKVNKDLGINALMKIIAHEATHARQIQNNQLWYTEEGIMWKGEQYISMGDFQKINRTMAKNKKALETYLNFPWEIEATGNEKNVVNDYMESQRFKDLKNNNPDNWVLDNLY